MKYSIFHIQGGLGKHVAATAVAKCIKNNHPDRKLIIVCAYVDIFINLDFVDRVYQIGNTQYFYQEYIKNKDSLVFYHEPYYTTDHIHGRKPLIKNWCDLYELEYNNEMPIIKFNKLQKNISEKFWKKDKPLLLLHTNGGLMGTQAKPYAWTRDMPYELACDLADHFRKDYHIYQVTKLNSPKIENVDVIYASMKQALTTMELFSLLLNTEKNILIDSCLQHAAAALNKKATVLWNGTNPNLFGYDLHDNIQAEINHDFKLPGSYLFDFDFNGNEGEYPFDENVKLFDIDKIIKSVEAK